MTPAYFTITVEGTRDRVRLMKALRRFSGSMTLKDVRYVVDHLPLQIIRQGEYKFRVWIVDAFQEMVGDAADLRIERYFEPHEHHAAHIHAEARRAEEAFKWFERLSEKEQGFVGAIHRNWAPRSALTTRSP